MPACGVLSSSHLVVMLLTTAAVFLAGAAQKGPVRDRRVR